MKKVSICNSVSMLSILTAATVIAMPQDVSAAFCSGSASSGVCAGYQEKITDDANQQDLVDTDESGMINI